MKIAEYLLFTDITIDQFASLLGISRSYVFAIMAGKEKISLKLKRRIVQISGQLITMDELNDIKKI